MKQHKRSTESLPIRVKWIKFKRQYITGLRVDFLLNTFGLSEVNRISDSLRKLIRILNSFIIRNINENKLHKGIVIVF